jgi:hypothetical protein
MSQNAKKGKDEAASTAAVAERAAVRRGASSSSMEADDGQKSATKEEFVGGPKLDTLRQVIYASKSTKADMKMDELVAILKVCAGKNALVNVTGALMFADGVFLQVLEGPPETIESILRVIRVDSRHSDVHVFYDMIVSARAFSNWQMAFSTPDVEEMQG